MARGRDSGRGQVRKQEGRTQGRQKVASRRRLLPSGPSAHPARPSHDEKKRVDAETRKKQKPRRAPGADCDARSTHRRTEAAIRDV